MNASSFHEQAIADREPRIEAVSFDNSWLVVEGGTRLDIASFLDEDKNPIKHRKDFNDAWYYVVKFGDDGQITIPSHYYEGMPSYADH